MKHVSGFDQKFWLEVGCVPRRQKFCFLFPSSVELKKLTMLKGLDKEHKMGHLVCCVSFASNSFDFLSRSLHALIQQMSFLKIKTTKEIIVVEK